MSTHTLHTTGGLCSLIRSGLLTATLLLGFACVETDDDACTSAEDEDAATQHTGFFTVPERTVAFGSSENETLFQVPAARLFYTFIPADSAPTRKPLFVFLNGGPGAATTAGLFLNGTAPYRLDPEGSGAILSNPASFTAIGNLLYIDPRMAGFSYDLSGCTESFNCPSMNHRSFHLFVDAGELLLTVMDVLSAGWIPQDTPVVLVGESYGGARVTMMLDFLLRPQQLEDPQSFFRDTDVKEALKAHYRATFPDLSFAEISHSSARQQFGHQVLIQPSGMLRNDQATLSTCPAVTPSDPRFELCRTRAGFGDLRSEAADNCFAQSDAVFTDPPLFELLFGVQPEEIDGLPPEEREEAFRSTLTKTETPMSKQLGTLSEVDFYYSHFGPNGTDIALSQIFGDLPFRLNLARVQTLITNAYYDTIVYTPFISNSLRLTETGAPSPSVANAWTDTAYKTALLRPGRIAMVLDDAFAAQWSLEQKEISILLPQYENAGHMVAFTQGEEFRDDVAHFISDPSDDGRSAICNRR